MTIATTVEALQESDILPCVMLSTLQVDQFTSQCVSGARKVLGFGPLLLLIPGERLEISVELTSLLLKYWISRLLYQDGLVLEPGMILICWKLETEA